MELSELIYDNGFPADMDKSGPIYLFNPEHWITSPQPCVMYKSIISGKWTKSYMGQTTAKAGMTEFNTELAALRARLAEVEAQNRCLLEEVYDLADCMCLEYHECVAAQAQRGIANGALQKIVDKDSHNSRGIWAYGPFAKIASEALAKLEEK